MLKTIPIIKEQLLKELNISNFKESKQKQPPNSLTFNYICIQKIQPQIRILFQDHFPKLKKMTITNCDLRTFENFPHLPSIVELDVCKNSLQGSFQFLVKNRSLEYLDFSDNIIRQLHKLDPLKILKNCSFYLKGNPISNTLNQQTINKILGCRVLKEPKQKQAIKKEEERKKDDNTEEKVKGKKHQEKKKEKGQTQKQLEKIEKEKNIQEQLRSNIEKKLFQSRVRESQRGLEDALRITTITKRSVNASQNIFILSEKNDEVLREGSWEGSDLESQEELVQVNDAINSSGDEEPQISFQNNENEEEQEEDSYNQNS